MQSARWAGAFLLTFYSAQAAGQSIRPETSTIAECAAAGQRAAQGHTSSQVTYGRCLLEDRSGLRNPVKAREVLEQAAAQGSPDAAIYLGKIYWNGDGVPKDNAIAAKWWGQAHKANHAEAPFLLGQEAMVRLFKRASSPRDLDQSLLRRTLSLFSVAARVDPSPTARTLATDYAKKLQVFATGEPATVTLESRQTGFIFFPPAPPRMGRPTLRPAGRLARPPAILANLGLKARLPRLSGAARAYQALSETALGAEN